MRWLVLAAFFAGCDLSFPDEYLVEDLRILELRVDPPEIPMFVDGTPDADPEDLFTFTPNFGPVRLDALVAHPDLDADTSLEWIRCEGEGGGLFTSVPCDGDRKFRLGTGQGAIVRPVQILFEEFQDFDGGPAEAVTSLAFNPRDLFNGAYLRINARAAVESANVEVDTLAIEGMKRLVLFDPAIAGFVIRQAQMAEIPQVQGLSLPSLCTRATNEQLEVIFDYLRDRVPNQRPRYVDVEILRMEETSTTTWTPGDAPIDLMPGESVRLGGNLDDRAFETFQLIDDSCELVEFTETMAWSWFTNVGTITDHVTSRSVDEDDDSRTIYRAPGSSELEDDVTRVRVWSVLRDGRGGSDNAVIDLVITKGG